MWLVPPSDCPTCVGGTQKYAPSGRLAPASGVGLQQHAVCSSTSAAQCCAVVQLVCSVVVPVATWKGWVLLSNRGVVVLRRAAVQVIPQRPVAVGGVPWLSSLFLLVTPFWPCAQCVVFLVCHALQ